MVVETHENNVKHVVNPTITTPDITGVMFLQPSPNGSVCILGLPHVYHICFPSNRSFHLWGLFFAVRGLAQIPPAQIGSSCESSVTSARLLRGIGSKLFLLLNLLTYIYNIYIIAEAGAASILLKIIKIGFHDLHQLSTLRLRRLPSWMNLFWNIFTAWASWGAKN